MFKHSKQYYPRKGHKIQIDETHSGENEWSLCIRNHELNVFLQFDRHFVPIRLERDVTKAEKRICGHRSDVAVQKCLADGHRYFEQAHQGIQVKIRNCLGKKYTTFSIEQRACQRLNYCFQAGICDRYEKGTEA